MTPSRTIELRSPGFEGIALCKRSVPDPAVGQVLLRMGGSCLNFHDAVVMRGLIPGLPYPLVPLSDGCGEVVAVGEGVTRVATGDRVMPNFYPRWIDGRPTPRGKKLILAIGTCQLF